MKETTDSPTPQVPAADVSRPNAQRLGIILAGIGGLVVVGFFYFDSRNAQQQLSSQVQQNADLQKQMANLEEVVSEIKTSKLYREQQETIARDDSLSAQQAGKLAEDRVAQLRQSITTWQTTRDKHLQGSEGRRIATDPKLIEQTQLLLRTIVPTADMADQLNERLQNLLKPVRDSIEQKTTTFKPADILPRIVEIDKLIAENLATVEQTTRDLLAIAKLAASSPPNQEMTLEVAVAGLEDRYAEEQRARLAEKLAEVRRESDEKVAKAKADSERRIAEAKAQAEKLVGEEAAIKIVAEAKRQQEQLAQERKKKEDEAREAALEKEFEKDLPQIRQSLSAFITHGFAYRDKKAPKGPISLAWLEGIGALENSRQGMERLTSVASHQNDRPRGALPFLIGNEYGWQQMPKEPITKAQDLLKKYGKLMVKKGLLAE